MSNLTLKERGLGYLDRSPPSLSLMGTLAPSRWKALLLGSFFSVFDDEVLRDEDFSFRDEVLSCERRLLDDV